MRYVIIWLLFSLMGYCG